MTKLERLVGFLNEAADNGTVVTRAMIKRRFRRDPSYVVYFNGLKRNGAITRASTINTHRIPAALGRFRSQNRVKQQRYYERVQAQA